MAKQNPANPTDDVLTTLFYLARDEIYDTEKPYRVSFNVDEIPGARGTNHVFAPTPTIIHDAVADGVRNEMINQSIVQFRKDL